MPYQVTYAGIPLAYDRDGSLWSWIEKYYPLDWTRVTLPDPSWPGRNLAQLGSPDWPARPAMKPGDFYYPSGVSRWAEAHFLASYDQVQAMAALALPSGQQAVRQPFVFQADPTPISGLTDQTVDTAAFGGINTNLFMLPPRPLSLPIPGRETVWSVSLVDERFFFQGKQAGIIHPTSGMTWSALLTQLCTTLGITDLGSTLGPHDQDPYGFVNYDSAFWSNFDNAALLLDSAAWNIGKHIYRAYDGSYHTVTAQQAWANVQNNRPPSSVVFSGTFPVPPQNTPTFTTAGGPVQTDYTSATRVVNTALPASIVVTFPKADPTGKLYNTVRPFGVWINDSYDDVYAVTITLVGSPAPYNGFQGAPTTTGLHDTSRALFVHVTDPAPTNAATLQALAQQLAQNYWDIQLSGVVDEVYPGIRNWNPDGLTDVLYRVSGDYSWTRLWSRPWNWAATEFSHDMGPAPVPTQPAAQALEVKSTNPGAGDAPVDVTQVTLIQVDQGSGLQLTGTTVIATIQAQPVSHTHSGVVTLTPGQVLGDGTKIVKNLLVGPSTFYVGEFGPGNVVLTGFLSVVDAATGFSWNTIAGGGTLNVNNSDLGGAQFNFTRTGIFHASHGFGIVPGGAGFDGITGNFSGGTFQVTGGIITGHTNP